MHQLAHLQQRGLNLIRSNQQLLDRIKQLRDTFGAKYPLAQKWPMKVTMPSPLDPRILGQPPTYTGDMDTNRNCGMLVNSSNSNFMLSGMTLADIPKLSLIPLPIDSSEIRNGTLYSFDYCRSASDELDAVSESQRTQKTRGMSKVLGLREPGPGRVNVSRTGRRERAHPTGLSSSEAGAPRISGSHVGVQAD